MNGLKYNCVAGQNKEWVKREELEDVKRELAWIKGALASQSNMTQHIINTLQQSSDMSKYSIFITCMIIIA